MLPLYWQPWWNVIIDNKNRPHRLSGSHLCKWIDTIYKNLNNVILTSVSCMVIHKLCYVFSPKQSLETWNYGNIKKNLVGKFIYCLIGSISINSTLREFQLCCMLSIIYNATSRTWQINDYVTKNVSHESVFKIQMTKLNLHS